MADFATLKSSIKTIIENQTTYFASGSVFGYEPEIGDVAYDPWAVIVPDGNENRYATTSENRRTYSFLIRVFVERNSRGNSDAEDTMTSIIDALLDALDADYTLSGTALYMSASPSAWGYVYGEKEYRTADLILQVKTDYDVTS